MLTITYKYLSISTLIIASLQFSFAQIDIKATKETKALYRNLNKISKKQILFGHQHATEYGHGWTGENDRSDVKSVTGSHPAVIGIDFSGLSGRPKEAIERTKEVLQKNVVATYERGGITTVAWHFSNPASKGGFYWKDSVSAPAISLIKKEVRTTNNTKKFYVQLEILLTQ